MYIKRVAGCFGCGWLREHNIDYPGHWSRRENMDNYLRPAALFHLMAPAQQKVLFKNTAGSIGGAQNAIQLPPHPKTFTQAGENPAARLRRSSSDCRHCEGVMKLGNDETILVSHDGDYRHLRAVPTRNRHSASLQLTRKGVSCRAPKRATTCTYVRASGTNACRPSPRREAGRGCHSICARPTRYVHTVVQGGEGLRHFNWRTPGIRRGQFLPTGADWPRSATTSRARLGAP